MSPMPCTLKEHTAGYHSVDSRPWTTNVLLSVTQSFSACQGEGKLLVTYLASAPPPTSGLHALPLMPLPSCFTLSCSVPHPSIVTCAHADIPCSDRTGEKQATCSLRYCGVLVFGLRSACSSFSSCVQYCTGDSVLFSSGFA